jgi:hypothetical protein
VSDPEVENLLRETFADRPVPAAAVELSPAVRRKSARRQRLTWGAAGVATLAVLAGAIFAAGALHSPAPVTLDQSAPPDFTGPATPGWRWESSSGAEIEVPETWTVNEWGCSQMTANPTVVRGQGGQGRCLSDEPAGKEVALLLSTVWTVDDPQAPQEEPLASSQVEIDGVAAIRTEGTLSDGRYAGSIEVPSRAVAVTVRTRHADVTKHILDSFRLVDVDHLGCAATTGWPKSLPKAEAGRPLLPEHPVKLVLCLYLGSPRLQSSTELTGDTAAGIAAAIAAAKEGRNPDALASQCLHEPPIAPDLVLLADGTSVSVVFSPCVGRGITDGRHWSQITKATVATLMAPTYAGYGMSGDLD